MAKAYAESIKASNQNVEITDDDLNMATPTNNSSEFTPAEENPFNQQAVEPEFQTAESIQEELPV